MKIALLSDEVINQIAAGEVIENPASVVKELVDNAIDAGARSIEVEIERGGQQKIKIEDDGCGMGRVDLELSLLRHATSKIKGVADLETLSTMGFRGEALAAIAAVSKLQILSSNSLEATRLWTEGGSVLGIEPIARNRGTTIEVASLFYNAPARRKFQKSSQATSAQISRIVQSLAIAHPEIAFSLQSQGQKILQVQASGWKERIEEVQGRDFCKDGFWFEEGDLYGLLCEAEAAKTTRLGQHLFLNRRPIFSPLLSKAIREGYGTRINEGSHPSFVLFLELPPSEFDVNVHPQKREVRFQNEAQLFCQIRDAIQRVFYPKQLERSISFTPPEPMPFSLREEEKPLPSFFQESFKLEEPAGQALAVIGLFLLAKKKGRLFLIDLRECYQETILATKEQQSLLWPLEVSLSFEENECLEEILQRCSEVGIDARNSGPRKICFDAVPKWLHLEEVNRFFDCVKEDLARSFSAEETLRRFAKNGSKTITLEEAEFLSKKAPSSKEIALDASDCERIFAKRYNAH